MNYKTVKVLIRCPECGSIQTAEVVLTIPFVTYVHECVKCNYIIMESEWEEVKNMTSKSENFDK